MTGFGVKRISDGDGGEVFFLFFRRVVNFDTFRKLHLYNSTTPNVKYGKRLKR